MQSGLSRRSKVTLPASGSTSAVTLTATPSGRPGIGSCWERPSRRERGQLADRLVHHPLGVVEPLADEGLDRLDAVALDRLAHPALADPGGADRGQVVPVPDLRHADPPTAHADDVVDVLVVLLDLDAGEDEAALGVDVLGVGHVGRRLGVAAVGLVGLGRGGEDVLAVDEDRDQDRVVGGVGVAEHRVVVQEGVALAQVRVQLAHRARLQPGAEHVHLQALGGGEELVVGGDDRAGEVPRHVEDRGATGAEERVGHLAHDRFEAVREHRHQRRVELVHGLGGAAGAGLLAHANSSL